MALAILYASHYTTYGFITTARHKGDMEMGRQKYFYVTDTIKSWQRYVFLQIKLTRLVCAVKNFLAVKTISQRLQLYILLLLDFALLADGTSS